MPTTQKSFKVSAYEQLARLGKALSAPKRLELMDLLSQSPRSVETIATLADVSIANASQHLKILRAAGLVEAHKEGLHVTYQVANRTVAEFLRAFQKLGEAQLAEMKILTRQYLANRQALEAIDQTELMRRARAGEIAVLDVRPIEEYQVGHISGAISIPLAQLKNRIKNLPKRREIVAYCRGPYCVMALDAVEWLRKKGYKAHRMECSVVEWRSHGGRIATGMDDA